MSIAWWMISRPSRTFSLRPEYCGSLQDVILMTRSFLSFLSISLPPGRVIALDYAQRPRGPRHSTAVLTHLCPSWGSSMFCFPYSALLVMMSTAYYTHVCVCVCVYGIPGCRFYISFSPYLFSSFSSIKLKSTKMACYFFSSPLTRRSPLNLLSPSTGAHRWAHYT